MTVFIAQQKGQLVSNLVDTQDKVCVVASGQLTCILKSSENVYYYLLTCL